MGANTSQVSDLCENQSLRTLIGTESISENDPFWNQLISFTFISPTSRTGNFGALVRIFLGRTKELKISTECQDQLFIWQAHNALFMIRCLLKVFINTGSEDLLEELMCNLVHLVVEVPL
ncbi:unnamed protein product, partial [Coregonus sp. 'balchen']